MRRVPWILLTLASVFATSSSAETNGVLSVVTYGAVCNGSTDDTAHFQAAAKAAADTYASTGSPVTVVYAGNCVIGGSIRYGSGVHWRGYGLITVPAGTEYPTFYAINADNVEWDHVDINFIRPYKTSSPYASGIGWFAASDSAAHYHVKVTNSRISNSSWGICIVYNSGTGSLTDVEIANNTITSPAPYSNWDGIHVGGAVTNTRIHDNTITNRGDAALALTSESGRGITYTLSGATIQNNIATQDLVGIDISGATNVVVSGNFVKATVPTSRAQNPAFRQINYLGNYPINIHTMGNYFESGSGASYTAKIDPMGDQRSWPPLNSTFEKNVIGGPNNPLYVRGSSIVIDGNTFTLSGGLLTIDYYSPTRVATSDVLIGTNRWLGDAAIHIGGDSSLIRNVKMSPQIVTGKTMITNGGNVSMLRDSDREIR
jgi:hypothetical protein